MNTFTDLGLDAAIARAVNAKGYSQPSPIQSLAIPHVLAGNDLLGVAATGTGKTAAFALPIIQRLAAENIKTKPGHCRALVLAPTRELALQIALSFKSYSAGSALSCEAVFGGVSFNQQAKHLKRGLDLVVATPGRLLDHLEQRTIRLDQVSVLVLDEADHMLDLGFIPSVRKIIKALPRARQNLLFSATMPNDISKLAGEILRNPQKVSVAPAATTPERVDQRVIFIETAVKRRNLVDLLREQNAYRTLVFSRTKHGADKIVKELNANRIQSAAIHGNKSQSQRQRVLEDFRSGKTPVLVATDIAARGIDINGIDLVVNYDLPEVPETYVHRIGRTARAGAAGIAISFCTPDDRPLLKAIEKLIGRQVASQPRPAKGVKDASRKPVQAAA